MKKLTEKEKSHILQAPAFATGGSYENGQGQEGLTKMEWATMQIMSGLAANGNANPALSLKMAMSMAEDTLIGIEERYHKQQEEQMFPNNITVSSQHVAEDAKKDTYEELTWTHSGDSKIEMSMPPLTTIIFLAENIVNGEILGRRSEVSVQFGNSVSVRLVKSPRSISSVCQAPDPQYHVYLKYNHRNMPKDNAILEMIHSADNMKAAKSQRKRIHLRMKDEHSDEMIFMTLVATNKT